MCSLRPVKFNYNDVTELGKTTKYETFTGFIAEELEQTPLGHIVYPGPDGHAAIRLSELTYTTINAIKELNAKLQALDNQVKQLESKNQVLEQKVSALQVKLQSSGSGS